MLRVGIIGSGFGLYGLLPAFSSLKNCNVVAICGKKNSRLITYCKSIGLENIYSDWKRMIENENLDVVAIAVTPKAQYEIAKFAINKKIHVFAEKPLSENYLHAKELYYLAKKNKIVHAIDFIFPEIDLWKKTKQLIDNKTLGQLHNIWVCWNFLSYDIKTKSSSWKTDASQGGGALSFFFSHTLFYLEYFCGEIRNIKSNIIYSNESLNKGDVGANLLFRFKNGVKGAAHLSSDFRGDVIHQIIFRCEDGQIILKNTKDTIKSFTLSVYKKGKRIKTYNSYLNDVVNEDERVSVVRKIAGRFITSCIKKTDMYPSFKEGFRVHKLIDTIRKNNE